MTDFPGGTVGKNLPASEGTRVKSWVWEHSRCLRATKPVCLNYGAPHPELWPQPRVAPRTTSRRGLSAVSGAQHGQNAHRLKIVATANSGTARNRRDQRGPTAGPKSQGWRACMVSCVLCPGQPV